MCAVGTNPGTPAPVLTSAGYLLLKAGTHALAAFEQALAADGLNGREFLVLTFVGHDRLSQQELSRRLGLDPTIVVGLIDALEERGLVSRERDPADRRRYVLSLTAAGRKLRARTESKVAEAEQDFLGPLPAHDRAHLRDLLEKVMRPRLPWLP